MRRLSLTIRDRVLAALDRYVESGLGDVRKLAGRQDEWRLRVGDYRVLFERNEAEQLIHRSAGCPAQARSLPTVGHHTGLIEEA